MQRIKSSFDEGLCLLDLDEHDISGVFQAAVERGVRHGVIPPELSGAVIEELESRERRFSTAIGHAVAVPHAYVEGLRGQVVVFVRLRHAVNMGAPDGTPTRYLFVLLGEPGEAAEHLDTLTAIARLMSDDEFRYDAGEAGRCEELAAALLRFEERTGIPVAEAPAVQPELEYTGRLGGGILADLRRRFPHYVSDFTDGLHSKTLSSTLFLYFACLAPTVTFGGLMYNATGETIGVTEMLASAALCGMVFALFGGQPLIILGGTGPLLALTSVLYVLCVRAGLQEHFLRVFAWIGIWSALFTILVAVTDTVALIRYLTRFTDEIFAALIAIIYTVEAVSQIVAYVSEAREAELDHDVAFLSIILALGTFIIAMLMSRMRTSRYLRPMAREFLADFGPTIAMGLMLLFQLAFPNVRPEMLAVPDQFSTTTGRPWVVDLLAAPKWVWFGSALPALFVTVLMYIDENITARIVNSPDNKLRKGAAYHLDMLVVGALMGVCSLLGLPWHVAATVRSVNHVRSLASFEETTGPGGESRQRIIHVREQRLTGFLIHALIGLSLLLLPLLQQVPQAVLYGLFLYMGIVSIGGNQFFERVMLWFQDPALYPRTHYINQVRMRTIHLFTLLQVVCLAVLWIVKSSPVGILFPLFIALLVPVRMLAGRMFSQRDLAALDADE